MMGCLFLGSKRNPKERKKKPWFCLIRWNPGWRISQVWYFFNGEGIEKFLVQQKMMGWKCSMGQQSRIICLIEPCFITSWCHGHYYRIRIIINSKGTSSLQPCKTLAKTIQKDPLTQTSFVKSSLKLPKTPPCFTHIRLAQAWYPKKTPPVHPTPSP